jgi:hypothetical protein
MLFLCPFSKAAWFCHPWYIRSEVFASNHPSIPDLIHAIISSGHPLASLENIYTFLWCLWKARNDQLFCRKAHKPWQVFSATNALLQGAKLDDRAHDSLIQDLPHQQEAPGPTSSVQDQQYTTSSTRDLHINHQVFPSPGKTVSDPWSIPGTKVFTDASWPQLQHQGTYTSKAGVGIFIQFEGAHRCSRLFISAVSPPAASALQAEAFGLLLAAKLTHHLQLQRVHFFTDNAILARAATTCNITEAPGHWQIRPQLAALFSMPYFNPQKIFHVPRSTNFKADFQAKLATRIQVQGRPFSFRCLASNEDGLRCSFRDVFSEFSDALCTLAFVKCC